jgi:hypothetical protein
MLEVYEYETDFNEASGIKSEDVDSIVNLLRATKEAGLFTRRITVEN